LALSKSVFESVPMGRCPVKNKYLSLVEPLDVAGAQVGTLQAPQIHFLSNKKQVFHGRPPLM